MNASTQLGAWWNGYEVVAATSAAEAREILRAMNMYDAEDLDGDGWKLLPDDKLLPDEDGNVYQTVGDAVKEAGKPGHLWSCEP